MPGKKTGMGSWVHDGPPACADDWDKLILQVDVLVASKIEAISPLVDKLMRLLKKTCCAPEHEFAVEATLREALANAVVHGNHSDPSQADRSATELSRGASLFVGLLA